MIYDVLIIGGGASGCFAAAHAAGAGKKTIIIERNARLMRKLSITGKGRCNLTNNSDIDTILKNIPANPRFLFSAISACPAEYVMGFFEKLGVPLKTERGNRVFPQSDKASDIVSALENELRRLDVCIEQDRVRSVEAECEKGFCVKGEKNLFHARKVIISTGGMSYPKTGSTGDGYTIAKQFGHTIMPPTPSLVPIITEENTDNLMGLSLKNVSVMLFDKTSKNTAKPLWQEQGEMIFTHFGLSGPLILSLSSHIPKAEKGRYLISIDLKPALDLHVLDKRILRDFSETKNKWFINSMDRLLPSKLIAEFVNRTGIPPQTPVNVITREQRQSIIKTLKNFEFTFEDFLSMESAVITDGGVSVKEINPKTMESKLQKGLYFCGEVIDVTGFTGGFNLQIAFSTAYLASL